MRCATLRRDGGGDGRGAGRRAQAEAASAARRCVCVPRISELETGVTSSFTKQTPPAFGSDGSFFQPQRVAGSQQRQHEGEEEDGKAKREQQHRREAASN